jgi:hypothetical protein
MATTPRKSGARDEDETVDTAVEDSFPASDPPSFTPGTGAAGDEEESPDHPKGGPHSDRHATETAAGRIEGHEVAEHKKD